ncbi:PadR family transcriptional regulator [Murinocardiopsis flavida]|uniref:PadR family transcriptional regulator n=1 Tax=Murinocardiopsis flavida TaxID=645275 RepID=A0A2P8DJP8_9ACTN|nr:PadR family transcriptional regulator [Murinocardiopsis flavida]PSK97445.1 PadR family transcriptional regulator [Murinocardiopsis flavida]
MSTIFGHGRLRLYLLKLLDESPRHGYEIISLLRDRFLGVYSPSPGTIYPRLARLEEEGLVTHEEVNGRKVYRLTDKGRAELHSRSSDLDDLEQEITESVRDVARAVKRDVRDTISHLRAELKFAAGDTRRAAKSEPAPENVWDAAGAEDPEGAERKGAAADSKAAGAERGDDAPGAKSGSWWERDWGRFAESFNVWGHASGTAERGGDKEGAENGESGRPAFDRALGDFSDRVRDVLRDAGKVSESAAGDLRRILDDTVEVIRRDARDWGPKDAADPDGPAGKHAQAADPHHGDAPPSAPADEPHPPFAQPPASADPWDTATKEPPPDPDTPR